MILYNICKNIDRIRFCVTMIFGEFGYKSYIFERIIVEVI